LEETAVLTRTFFSHLHCPRGLASCLAILQEISPLELIAKELIVECDLSFVTLEFKCHFVRIYLLQVLTNIFV